MTEKLDADAVGRSITGFEQISIKRFFGSTLAELGNDELMMLRVLAFIDRKRSGTRDQDAFKYVMDLALNDVTDLFENTPDPDPDPDGQAEEDMTWADFVIATGLSFTPREFSAMTLGQRDALVAAIESRR